MGERGGEVEVLGEKVEGVKLKGAEEESERERGCERGCA